MNTQEFRVRYSTGQAPLADQPRNNTFGLTGVGKLIVDATKLVFEGNRTGFNFGGTPQIALADIANVDYSADKKGFLIRIRDGRHYIIFWADSPEDAEAIWALLPQQKTAEFLADEQHHDRFAKAMSVLGGRAYVTPVIIAINVAVFIAMLAAGADLVVPNSSLLIRFGSDYRPLTWTGQEWRLLTSVFLHFGIIHIALNMFALYQGGALIEKLFGSTRYALIYLLSALAGNVVSGWWQPLGNGLGASAAIFGVYGALLAFFAIRREDIPPTMLKSISSSTLLFCLYSLVIGWAHPLIDNAAHIGGLLAGFISGLILARPFTPEGRATAQPVRLVLAAVAILVPLAFLAQPLLTDKGSHAIDMRFEREVHDFVPIEAELVRKQTDILTFPPNARFSRLDVARRLRSEVLEPWRAASRPLLQSPTVDHAGSLAARRQAAIRTYLRVREEAIALRVLALETGDSSDEEQAIAADARLSEIQDQNNALARE